MKKKDKVKVIYNLHAGKKRKMVTLQATLTLKQLQDLLEQYQIPADFYPTQYPGHASLLAKNADKEGYKMVVAAGGDGTVGEAIAGLAKTDTPLAILPVGSFMNVARMLSIPRDLEQAVMLIKIGRIRKIDIGSITQIGGENLSKSHYFLEEAGIGLEAQMHYYLTGIFERGEYINWLKIIKTLFRFYGHPVKVFLDEKEIETKATLVTVSNGALGGASLKLAPKAKLNDHQLTVRIWNLSKLGLTKYLLSLLIRGYANSKKVKSFKAKKVRIETHVKRLIHADARVFGATPVEFKVIPNALSVITGFSKEETEFLKNRTPRNP